MAEKSDDRSPHRVAYDLALMVARAEGKYNPPGGVDGDRKYWLDLYARCFQVVAKGRSADFALKDSTGPDSVEPDVV